MSNLNLYEQDFNAWIAQQIQLLQQGKIAEIDIPHLIEELQDMGKSNLRELESRLIILIAHLLKWQFQFNQLAGDFDIFDGKSWRRSIIEQRNQIAYLLENVPSLRRDLPAAILKIYGKAVEFAADETSLPANAFPKNCPYTLEQLLDKQFYPTASH